MLTFCRTLSFLFLSCALWSACSHPDSEAREDSRPNILLIMADDMGFSDIGCYGGEIMTPHLDRLAAGGLRYKQFYNTARCCPTRASLMTGLYPHQAGVGHMTQDRGTDGYRGDLNAQCVTIAEVLKSAGYHTYMSGKWHVTQHLGPWDGDSSHMSMDNWPRQRGFDRFYGTITGAGSFYDPVTLTRDNTPIQPESAEYYYTDAIADQAMGFIEGHPSGHPFFMYVSFTAPHWPLHAREADIAPYLGRYDMGWDALRQERLERMRKLGILDPAWPLTERDPQIPSWEDAEDKSWEARRMAVYAAQVSAMDRNIGRLIGQLEAQGRLDNTLIFFLADNGGCAEELWDTWKGIFISWHTRSGDTVFVGNQHRNMMPGPENTYQSYGRNWAQVSNTPFRLYKHFVHEGGISSPLIVHWPDGFSAQNEWRETPAHLIDIMATCVEVAEAEYPARFGGQDIHPMEGRSLVPTFEGQALSREALYWEHEGNRAVRQGKWKLVARGRAGPWELYDMEADRSETQDLAGTLPEKVVELARLWQAYAERTGVIPWPK